MTYLNIKKSSGKCYSFPVNSIRCIESSEKKTHICVGEREAFEIDHSEVVSIKWESVPLYHMIGGRNGVSADK